MNNKILCIGDSLALPGHLNLYEDTWYYKLKKRFPTYDFISYFKRQLTTDALVTLGGGEKGVDKWPKGADCLEAYMPAIVILQLGIVDCAPRLLHKNERHLVSRLPALLSNFYLRVLKKIRKRRTERTIVPFN
jgi:acyl-CoA thioesterase I